MSSRASRGDGGSSMQDTMASLSLRDRLLVSQVIYELGCDWTKVSQLVIRHPLIDRPKDFFSPRACQGIYLQLMKDFGSDFKDKIPEDAKTPKAPRNLLLAQECYKLRVAQLREEILNEEKKFKKVAQEIEDIQLDKPVDVEQVPTAIDKGRKSKQPAPAASRRSTRSVTRVSEAPSSIDAEPAEEDGTSAPNPVIVERALLDGQPPTTAGISGDKEVSDIPMMVQRPEGVPSMSTEPMIGFIEAEVSRHSIPLEAAIHANSKAGQPSAALTLVPVLGRASSVPMDTDLPNALVSADKEAVVLENKDSPTLTTPATPTDLVSDGLPPKAEPAARRATRRQTLVRSGRLKASEELPTVVSAERKRALVDTPAEEEPASSSKRPRASTLSISSVSAASAKKMMGVLHTRISEHRFGNIFHNPIKMSDAPDYYNVIKRPMDLKTIKQRIKEGTVKDSQEFQRDVYLMYANALMFNGPQTEIYRMTMEMMQETEKDFQLQLQSEVYRPN
ncbi:hypothetical protein FRB93_011607 [Tulasnella sp. JGI-2019a]|nr:hypothetical protein FRB93_011607 [Tulasnella sp. JGI-2019a]